MASVLKLTIPNLNLKPNLTKVSIFTRNINLIKHSGIFTVSINEVICQVGPLHPPEEEAICMTIYALPFPLKRYPGLKINPVFC